MEEIKKILLVDDNHINRKVMGSLLKGMNLEVVEATDGFEAIDLAKKQEFHMIFMDVFMPGMDGYETSSKIRELGGVNGSIPIIAVTANDVDETEGKIADCGMNGVLSKPLRKDDLEKLLNIHFSNDSNNKVEKETEVEIFDKDGFESLYDDKSLRIEILNAFFDEKQKNLKDITDAFKSKDCILIHEALHYMKGSFSYLNAPKILMLTQRILDLTSDKKIVEALKLKDPLFQNYDELYQVLANYMALLKN